MDPYSTHEIIKDIVNDFMHTKWLSRRTYVNGSPVFISSYNFSHNIMTPMMVPMYYHTEFLVFYMNNHKSLISDDLLIVSSVDNKMTNLYLKEYNPLSLWNPKVNYHHTIKLGSRVY